VAVAGRPNVGKSTLINTLIGQKIAAVSPRPQTTRRKQLGILTLNIAQIIFLDTPGIHHPVHRLGEWMNQEALDALYDADLVLWIVDISSEPTPADLICSKKIAALGKTPPVLLAMNKIDLILSALIVTRSEMYHRLLPESHEYKISATTGQGIRELLNGVILRLPEGPLYYPDEQVTDFYERDIAVELIREAALLLLRDEVPHCLAVRLDEYKDRDVKNSYIKATIFVEKDSHKGIVIGKGGSMLKKIGIYARNEIESMTGRRIYLELGVKVSENWRNDEHSLKLMGYDHRD